MHAGVQPGIEFVLIGIWAIQVCFREVKEGEGAGVAEGTGGGGGKHVMGTSLGAMANPSLLLKRIPA